jgi:hypothetical protein
MEEMSLTILMVLKSKTKNETLKYLDIFDKIKATWKIEPLIINMVQLGIENKFDLFYKEIDEINLIEAYKDGILNVSTSHIFITSEDSFFDENINFDEILNNLYIETDVLYGNTLLNVSNKLITHKPQEITKIIGNNILRNNDFIIRKDLLITFELNSSLSLYSSFYELFLKLYLSGYDFKYCNTYFSVRKSFNEFDIRIEYLEYLQVILENENKENLLENNVLYNLIDMINPSLESLNKYYLRRGTENQNLKTSINMNKISLQVDSISKKYKTVCLYGNGLFTNLFKNRFEDKDLIIVDKVVSDTTILPEQLSRYNYDCILIMVLGREKEITDFLIGSCNVDKSKIIKFEL